MINHEVIINYQNLGIAVCPMCDDCQQITVRIGFGERKIKCDNDNCFSKFVVKIKKGDQDKPPKAAVDINRIGINITKIIK